MKRTATAAALLALALGATACGGDDGGGGRSSSDLATKGPIKIWLSNNPEELAWGKAMVAAWNAEEPQGEGHRPGDPGRQDLRGGHRRRDHRRQRAVPGLQHLAGGGAAVPEAGRAGRRWTTSPAARSTSRPAPATTAEQYKSPDGKFYQMPWKSNPVMIFYNKDLMKKAGVDPENPPLSTYDEFLATSDKIVSSGAAQAAIWPAPSSEFFQSWFDFYPLYAAESGGKQLVEDGKATFNDAEGKAVANFWADDVREGLRARRRSTTATRSPTARPRCPSSARGRSRSTATRWSGAPRRCRPRPACRPRRRTRSPTPRTSRSTRPARPRAPRGTC